VLDLRCNPLNSESYRKSSEPSSDAAERLAYRSFTIHHLPQLRMLDGTIISLHETQQVYGDRHHLDGVTCSMLRELIWTVRATVSYLSF